jgi:hypothetical protein
VVLALATVSCGKSGSARPVFPVRGQVLLDGKPLAGVQVAFHPVAAPGPDDGRPYARTDANGRFAVSTYGTGDGAPPGEYKISLHDLQNSGGNDEVRGDEAPPKARKPSRIAAPYANPDTSGLRIRVSEGPNELEPFQLKPGPPAPTLPPRVAG